MPTSMTAAPGLTQSPLTIRSRPTAAMRTSARRQTPGRSRVREWQIVTVALAPSRSWAIGLPKRFERPTIDGLGALQLRARLLEQEHHAHRRARPQPLAPQRQQPGADRREAVDVLAGLDELGQLDAVEVVGDRQLAEDPADGRVGVELLDEVDDLLARGVGRQAVVEAAHADLGGRLLLVGHVDGRARVLAHEDGRQPRRRPCSAVNSATPAADLGAHARRHGLAIDDRLLASRRRRLSLAAAEVLDHACEVALPDVLGCVGGWTSSGERRSDAMSRQRRAGQRRGAGRGEHGAEDGVGQSRRAGVWIWIWRTRMPAGRRRSLMRARIGVSQREVVRSRSVVWVVAVILTAAFGAGSAHAQRSRPPSPGRPATSHGRPRRTARTSPQGRAAKGHGARRRSTAAVARGCRHPARPAGSNVEQATVAEEPGSRRREPQPKPPRPQGRNRLRRSNRLRRPTAPEAKPARGNRLTATPRGGHRTAASTGSGGERPSRAGLRTAQTAQRSRHWPRRTTRRPATGRGREASHRDPRRPASQPRAQRRHRRGPPRTRAVAGSPSDARRAARHAPTARSNGNGARRGAAAARAHGPPARPSAPPSTPPARSSPVRIAAVDAAVDPLAGLALLILDAPQPGNAGVLAGILTAALACSSGADGVLAAAPALSRPAAGTGRGRHAQRFWIGAYSAMSLRSLPSEAKRTTTMPPGSRPTDHAVAEGRVDDVVAHPVLGARRRRTAALDHDIARGRAFCDAATAPIACSAPSRSVRSGGISLRKRLRQPVVLRAEHARGGGRRSGRGRAWRA